MQLYPKARPVRIKLSVGGEEHSSLDSLRENFDIVEILRLYENGGLKNWLKKINQGNLWEQLSVYTPASTWTKYERCINVFFDSLSNPVSLEERLLDWSSSSYSNFKYLLLALKDISTDDFKLSVKNAKIIKNNIVLKGDNESLKILSSIFYSKLKEDFSEIFKACSNLTDSIEEIEYKLDCELRWQCIQWEIKLKHKARLDLTSLSHAIIASGLVSYHKDQIKNLIDRVNYSITKAGFNSMDIKAFQSVQDILHRYFEASYGIYSYRDSYSYYYRDFDNRIHISFFKVLETIEFTAMSWNCDYSSPLKISSSSIFDTWSTIILRVYFCYKALLTGIPKELATALLPLHRKANQMLQLMTNVYKTYGGKNLDKSSDIKKLLYQSLILCSTIGCKGDQKDSIIEELNDRGYRPSLLMSGKVTPENSMEEEFVKLEGVDKIPYLVEHILEF